MAGYTPPKAPEKRARRNKDPREGRVLPLQTAEQPPLPARPGGDPWPARTLEWWQMWRESALSSDFTASDWSELMDAAVLHANFWSGDTKLAAELRQRVAKFGATPEDRARLRITFAQADEADAKRPARKPEPDYGDLRVVGAVAGS